MRAWDRLVVRGLRSHLASDVKILALERGESDALGEMRRTTAVLTEDALLLATPVRIRTILTTVPRLDIQSVDVLKPHVVAIRFDDYTRAARRVVQLDLSKHGDRSGIVAKLNP
ncbi:MAG: hypothetical protein QOF40_2652 [Actinomycetota bacterium]|jgi:hypothetical protein|nr:hypothetical protein [Actinomycetota bacterium]